MLLQKESPEVIELLRKSVYAYYCLLKAFPQEIAGSTVKFGALARLIQLVPFFNERRIVHLVLEVIEATLGEVTESDFQNIVAPFLTRLAEVGFEVG
jgi:hypothetical protein